VFRSKAKCFFESKGSKRTVTEQNLVEWNDVMKTNITNGMESKQQEKEPEEEINKVHAVMKKAGRVT